MKTITYLYWFSEICTYKMGCKALSHFYWQMPFKYLTTCIKYGSEKVRTIRCHHTFWYAKSSLKRASALNEWYFSRLKFIPNLSTPLRDFQAGIFSHLSFCYQLVKNCIRTNFIAIINNMPILTTSTFTEKKRYENTSFEFVVESFPLKFPRLH